MGGYGDAVVVVVFAEFPLFLLFLAVLGALLLLPLLPGALEAGLDEELVVPTDLEDGEEEEEEEEFIFPIFVKYLLSKILFWPRLKIFACALVQFVHKGSIAQHSNFDNEYLTTRMRFNWRLWISSKVLHQIECFFQPSQSNTKAYTPINS